MKSTKQKKYKAFFKVSIILLVTFFAASMNWLAAAAPRGTPPAGTYADCANIENANGTIEKREDAYCKRIMHSCPVGSTPACVFTFALKPRRGCLCTGPGTSTKQAVECVRPRKLRRRDKPEHAEQIQSGKLVCMAAPPK